MKVNVEYDKYNTSIVKATIPLSEDASFVFEANEVAVPEGENIKKVQLKYVDSLNTTEQVLAMDKSEVRELVSLINSFRN